MMLRAAGATQPLVDIQHQNRKVRAVCGTRAEGPTAFVSIMEAAVNIITYCVVQKLYTRGEERSAVPQTISCSKSPS